LAHYRTKYETTVTAPDGRRFLLLYTESRSFAALLRCLRQRGAELCDRLGLDDSARATRTGRGRFPALDFGNGWTAQYSGRTQLEARAAGEYPWIFDR
jgi:hypothetical protein